MALARLWNALFGKKVSPASRASIDHSEGTLAAKAPQPSSSTAKMQTAATAVTAVADDRSRVARGGRKVREPRGSQVKRKPNATTSTAATPAPEPATPPSVLRMFKRKTNSWSKLVSGRRIASILDLRVDSTQRATELLEAIVDSHDSGPRYIAIGDFESATDESTSTLTVRQFHHAVRVAGGVPVIVPKSLGEGLHYVARTFGAVDLVLVDARDEQLAEPLVAKMLTRVAHHQTLMLRADPSGRWQVWTRPISEVVRRVA